jgi:hypothetical protein
VAVAEQVLLVEQVALVDAAHVVVVNNPQTTKPLL